jgi:hypothetical protein
MPAPVLQFKRGNAGIAGTVPALRPGEPAISLNNFDFFIGIDTSVVSNKFFGSHRYWEREENGVKSLKLKLVSDNGSQSINLRAPVSLGATFTYTLPATAIGYSGKVLSTNGDGQLSWVDQVNTLGVEEIVIGIGTFTNNVAFTTTTVSTSSTTGAVTIAGGLGVSGTSYFGSDLNVGGDLNVTGTVSFSGGGGADFSGITTFSNTTDNTLGNVNTGAVQIDGGLGVEKNVTIGAGLSVGGQSYFIGTATFYGGQINLGNGGDVINIDGSINSNVIPTIDATYDVGISTLNWRNAHFSGIGTFESGVDANNINIGIGDANTVTTSTGKLTLNSAIGVVEIPGRLDVLGDIDVSGNVFIGGTTITLRGEDVFIENKDIVLGYTTSVTPSDTTANHAGVAIASEEGTPLVSFQASGINTLPDTYKQMMWFRSGTLGFATDAFAFNYGVAIGTTTMADGVRLAVGSSITMTDDTINATSANFTNLNATNITGSLTGTISTATRATTVDTVTAADAASTHYITFVNSHNGTASAETVYTDDGIYYNPGTNTFTTQNALFTGNVEVQGTLTGTATTATRAQNVDVAGVASNQNYNLVFSDGSGNSKALGVDSELVYNPNTNTFKVGTGVGITQFSSSVSTGTSTSSVPTSSAIINYVGSQIGNVDLTLSIAGDTGTGSVNTSQTFTIAGTANEVNTSASGQTITVGLPDAVIVGTSLSAPTIKTNIIQSQNTGSTVLTLTGNDATFADDLTVQGNLYVQGSTTQIDTTTLAIEDRTIELGRITSGTQPTTTTWDLAVLFNYGDSGAKKAGLVWEASGATKRFQFTTDVDPGSDGSDSQTNLPSFTVANFAPIEIGQLWVTDCAGTSQVISCTGTERFLENITVDAGTF